MIKSSNSSLHLIQRQSLRRRRYSAWCRRAGVISKAMQREHGLPALQPTAQFRLALRLKLLTDIYWDLRGIQADTTKAGITRQLSAIKGSILMIADFWRDVEKAITFDPKSERYKKSKRPHSSDIEKRSAVQALQRTASKSGVAIDVEEWFSQALFLKKLIASPEVANRPLDAWKKGPSSEASLAGEYAVDLFQKTYPGVPWGSRGREDTFSNACGYTFATAVVKVVTGERKSPHTIRTHIANFRARARGLPS